MDIIKQEFRQSIKIKKRLQRQKPWNLILSVDQDQGIHPEKMKVHYVNQGLAISLYKETSKQY